MSKGTDFLNKDREKFKIAVDIFSSKGYHSTTMDEVAQAMGVAKGTIYYHFKNKDELYLCTTQLGISILEIMAREAIGQHTDSREKIVALIESYLLFMHDYAGIAYIFLRELFGDHNRRDFFREATKSYQKLIQNVLEEGQRAGAFAGDLNAEICASSIFGMIFTVAIHYLQVYGELSMDVVKDNICKLIFHGLLEV
ncbi:transcriptional regulator, TetR family [Desulfocucumis palustris]|uniref:Transcriptional regulator, TetR family n=1 Tax=Desulfocucumis palustris TaxID=1898651 RepID=A0A2L2XIU0_9FIRM|nr:TetR/AcrR family transcriptional regulator [Desulfocucumis palustris]GBF35623.1 transcriptional regulator, TetR family [Desulfocucumis palustris]